MKTEMYYDPFKVNDRKCVTIYLTHKCQLRCGYCYVGCNQDHKSLCGDMNESTKEKVVQYIKELYSKFKPGTSVEITLSGGEVGLLDPDEVLQFLYNLKTVEREDLDILYSITTNLVYKITDAHLRLFKFPDLLVSATFDGGVRFENKAEEDLWYFNLQVLKENNIKTDISFLLTKQFIDNYTPKFCFDLIDKYNIVGTDMFQIYKGRAESSKQNYESLRATNLEANKWQLQAFLEYEKWDNAMCEIASFEAIKQALVGNCYYCYSRSCTQDQINIQPDGRVLSCDFCYPMLVDNVVNRLEDAETRKVMLLRKEQTTFSNRCQGCKYMKWCRGGCFNALSDETDCGMPHQIFEYLITKYGIE